MDIGTGLSILGGSFGSIKLLEKLIGPTADYFGEELKDFNKKRFENLKQIFEKTIRKLGSEIEQKGTIHPIILKEIFENATYYDDETVLEYYSGILASSRTVNRKDDRSKTLLKLISRLSTYQIRGHYIIYNIFKSTYDERLKDCCSVANLKKHGIEIPCKNVFNIAMDFSKKELSESIQITSHILQGLEREGLIMEDWGLTKSKRFNQQYSILVNPSLSGYELMLWANGYSEKHTSEFYKKEIIVNTIKEIIVPFGSEKFELQIKDIFEIDFNEKFKRKGFHSTF